MPILHLLLKQRLDSILNLQLVVRLSEKRDKVTVYSGADGSVIWTQFASQGGQSDYFGSSLSEAEDLSGVGVPDLIVGATGDGSSPAYAKVFSGANGSQILYSLAGSGSNYGSSVDSFSDVDGDGIPEILVGAPANGLNDKGSAYVISGSSGIFHCFVNGVNSNEQLGIGIRRMGDLNSDGYEEFAVASRSAIRIYSATVGGACPFYSSSPFHFSQSALGFPELEPLAALSDIDGDGKVDLVASDIDTSSGVSDVIQTVSGSTGSLIGSPIPGLDADDEHGFSVADVGDQDGDNQEDFIVGAPDAFSPTGSLPGYARLYSGNNQSVIATYGIDASAGHRELGYSVASIGDVDGDGKEDFILGEPGYSGSLTGQGRILFFYSDGGTACLENIDLEGVTLSGNQVYQAFDYVSAGDDTIVTSGAHVTLQAKNSVQLRPGFSAEEGASFTATANALVCN